MIAILTQQLTSQVDVGTTVPRGVPILASCFTIGTRIVTPGGGWRVVEDLAPGDPVVTQSGAIRIVRRISRRRIDSRRHPAPEGIMPIRVKAGAFAPDMPQRDLLLSPDHAVLVKHVLMPVGCLRNGMTIVREHLPAVTYLSIELDTHDVLLAEGLPVESCLAAADPADTGTVMPLYPVFDVGRTDVAGVWGRRAYAPMIVRGPKLAAERRRLAQRAEAMGWRKVKAAPLP